jgi:hypothetical protein
MAFKRKSSSKKIYLAVILLIILIAAAAAVVYVVANPPPKVVTVGVNIGDTFTYNITSTSTLIGLDAVEPPGFFQYNQTDYYKITITGITGTNVSMDTLWRFKNGTEVTGTQLLDIANGKKVDDNGFWALYPANLNVGDLLRPKGFDGLTVNRTDTRVFADSTRWENFWFIDNQFYNVNDPTQSTQRYDYTGVTFDKTTGMLETLTNYQEYNNPAMKETITWNLFNSSLWLVN